MDINNPIFIVGSGRCGTSMLLQIINRFSGVSIPAESHFIPSLYRKYGDNYLDDNAILSLLADIKSSRYVSDWDFKFNDCAIISNVHRKTYSGVIRSLYECYAGQKGKARWGDKTPSYLKDLVLLSKCFPDAKFIHIVRDGRDCALSVMKCAWGPMNLYKAALWWTNSMLKGKEQIDLLRKNREDFAEIYKEFKYEDMIRLPESNLRELFEFIGESFDSKLLENYEINRNNVYKWKSEFNENDKELFESVAGDVLRGYGYECSCKKQRSIPGYVRLLYLLDNFFKSHKNLMWDVKRKLLNKMYVKK